MLRYNLNTPANFLDAGRVASGYIASRGPQGYHSLLINPEPETNMSYA